MDILIVEEDPNLAGLWARHLRRGGARVCVAADAQAAMARIEGAPLSAMIVDVGLSVGSAMSIADYARFRQPQARVILVTAQRFFSDGSIFELMPNACAYLARGTDPEDLAAVVDHHARRA
ncbi:MAG: response regulator [Rhodobacteraceae bacterium]|jgi:DNA-binding response OmpR family regulator|nr:response regulator [Paracoccaceae bacterium]